jgi:hypothetical protein
MPLEIIEDASVDFGPSRAFPGVYQALKILLFSTSSDPCLSALIRGKVLISWLPSDQCHPCHQW